MSKYKGFGEWIEIFKGGRQVDSSGAEHDGDALIDKAVATFSATEHEPPVVVGHPKDNAPAFGWVKELRADVVDGVKRLFMLAGDVVPEFEDLVKGGRYKKRSAAFYPDGRLRHVGFLGAVPPAVKGLADLKFETGEQYIEFADGWNMGLIGTIFSRIREWMIEDKGIEVADRLIPVWDVDMLKQEANRPEDVPSAVYNEETTKTEVEMPEEKQFSEADVKTREEAAAAKAKEEGRKEATQEFAEQQMKSNIAAFKERNWPTSGTGKLPPALLDAGVMEFMEQLDGIDTIEFAEGKSETLLDWFMNFLEGLPKAVEFQEIAGRGIDLGDGNAGDKIAALVTAKQKEKGLLYGAAFAEVQTEHPDLAREYLVEMGK